MIQNIGLGIENNLQGFVEPLEVGDQYFHPATRREFANLANGFGENASSAQVIVIAIHTGHDGMLQAECGHGFSDPSWFVPLDRTRFALGDGAKSATPGANIAQQHERGGAVIPALPNIGTLSRLAHRVQSQAAGQLLEIVKVLACRRLRPKPLRLGLPHRRPDAICTSWEVADMSFLILHATEVGLCELCGRCGRGRLARENVQRKVLLEVRKEGLTGEW